MILMIVGLFLALTVGCGGESAESLFGTVQFEEKQTNFEISRACGSFSEYMTGVSIIS